MQAQPPPELQSPALPLLQVRVAVHLRQVNAHVQAGTQWLAAVQVFITEMRHLDLPNSK